MLVKLTDIKKRDIWINPLYVRAIIATKGGVAEVHGTFGGTWTGRVIKVRDDARALADRISVAMPESAALIAAVQADEELRQQQAAAAASATTG